MGNLSGYNANDHDPAPPSADVIPAGIYTAMITKSEESPLKSGNGSKFEMTYQVADGEYKGLHVWDYVNHNHPSPRAKKFAMARLSQICRALGIMMPDDTSQFLNKPLKIRVGLEKNEYRGEVKDVNTLEEVLPLTATDAAPPQASGQDPATQGNAWG